MKRPSFSVSVTTASQLHDGIDRLLPLLRADASHAPAARALAAAAASLRPPSTFLSNRVLHLLSSHPATLPDALALLSSLPSPDVCSYNTLVAALARSPRGLASARALFDRMPLRDHFSWSAIVSAHARHGQPRAALAFYRRMLREPEGSGADNEFTASSALAAATAARCVRSGRELHCHVIRRGIDADAVVWSALADMYAKNGQSEEALCYFNMFLRSGLRPDRVMFVGALSACAHAGLVDKGLEIFHSIKDEWAAEALFEIEPENPATYVTLANIYASVGLFDEVENVRKIMESKGITKMPASSWIEVGKRVHVFLVGDKSHPRAEEIYALLKKMYVKMREEGYVADISFVLHDVEEEQEEQDIGYHSERLAVAFGIIATPGDAPIKVFKNLRICGDCHATIKFISWIVQREIIVRDSNRFHHFKNGICSCRDYW
ncbi:hypothetical protein HU200_011139 [Digitaria exilis]|uniref:DYW domain-containing protein n=1 Tax=Digitaria exilis TaxID=1010633 RepID=A0A835FHP5_9POAL|nr:hypothetical protein HU200_011139 [Digitaria exilis]